MTKTHQSIVTEYREKLEEILPLIVKDYNDFVTHTGGEIGEMDIEEIVNTHVSPLLTQAMNAAARGVEEIANKEVSDYRQHLCFLYRWISRLNGDKSHDTPEKQWREYVAVMVNYPSAPYQTSDWFEDDEPKSAQLQKYLGEV